jgi:hypothetical protein
MKRQGRGEIADENEKMKESCGDKGGRERELVWEWIGPMISHNNFGSLPDRLCMFF